MYVDMSGAASGGKGVILDPSVSFTPGYGARVQSYLSVIPGTLLHVTVGGKGSDCSGKLPSTGLIHPGGYNGGGSGSGTTNDYGGTGGGGASDIRIGGLSLSNRAVVAGGGGGHYCHSYCGTLKGGDGDRFGHAGSDGLKPACAAYSHNSGGGGTWVSGGTAGFTTGSPPSTPGITGYGGNGGATSNSPGGGGGYFGGNVTYLC
jgi:hypothetical protein